MQKDDAVYIAQMIEHIEKAMVRVARKSRADFDADEDLRYGLLHLVQIVGEAARRVSDAFREAHSGVPWRDIVGIRHKIVHDYVDINERILWEVVTLELPRLLEQPRGIGPRTQA